MTESKQGRGRFWAKPKDVRKRADGEPERAGVLCRQSKTIGPTVSLGDQELHCRRYCAERGYEISADAVTISPNLRGWKEERADHDRFRALAAAGQIDVVVAYDVFRAARTVRILEQFAYDLERTGCRLEFASQPFANHPAARQMIVVFGEMETEGRSVRQQDLWSHLMSLGWWHGRPPYGYRLNRESKHLDLNEDEAPWARWIWARRAEGMSTIRIADALERQGVPTRHGRPWGADTLVTILANPAYLGHVARNGAVVCEDAHPALVEPRDWERVRALDQTQVKVRRKGSEQRWLEGLVEHACGARAYLQNRRMTRARGRVYNYPVYLCRNAFRPEAVKCRIKPGSVSMHKVETAAQLALVKDLAAPADWRAAYREAHAAVSTPAVDLDRSRLESRRRELEKRREAALELALSRRIDFAKFDAIAAECDAAAAELAAALASLPQLPDWETFRRNAERIAELGAGIAFADEAALASALGWLGVAVIHPDGVSIRYRAEIAPLFPAPCRVPYPDDRPHGKIGPRPKVVSG